MPKYYAQLNEYGIVHTICQVSGEIEEANIVEINSIDSNLMGKKYKQDKFYDLNIESPKTAKQNEVANITLRWLDIEGNLVDDITEITVTIGEIEEKIIAENGVIEVEFSSEEIGIFKIEAACEDGCKAKTRIEVVEDA